MAKITAEQLELDMPLIERLHTFWKRMLDQTIEDGIAESITRAVIVQGMMNCAITEYARLNGAAETARELYLLALKFRQAADMETGANSQSSTAKQ